MIAAPRPASTVVLCRPCGDGWETYLLRRSAQSPVLAELWVFPGGTLRKDDLDATAAEICPALSADLAHQRLTRPPDLPAESPQTSLGYHVAAGRELFEESGVLLGPDQKLDRANLARVRVDLEQGHALAAAAAKLKITVALDQLIYYAHWITPEAVPQRFDTRFFVATVPPDQEASPSAYEMTDGVWIDPSVVRQADRTLSRVARARLTFSRISSARAVQMNGVGA